MDERRLASVFGLPGRTFQSSAPGLTEGAPTCRDRISMSSSSPQRALREENEPPQTSPSLSRSALRHVRRVIVGVVGITVVLIGVAMIVLPGPAVVVIPAGLGILAVEFTWAKRLLEQLKQRGSRVLGKK